MLKPLPHPEVNGYAACQTHHGAQHQQSLARIRTRYSHEDQHHEKAEQHVSANDGSHRNRQCSPFQIETENHCQMNAEYDLRKEIPKEEKTEEKLDTKLPLAIAPPSCGRDVVIFIFRPCINNIK